MRSAPRPTATVCLCLLLELCCAAGLDGDASRATSRAKHRMTKADVQLLAEADALLASPEDSDADLGESDSVDSVDPVDLGVSVATGTGTGSGSGAGTALHNPPTSFTSEGECTTNNLDAPEVPSTDYHSLNQLVGEFLQMRDRPATADYAGKIENADLAAGDFNHVWRRGYREVACEMKAHIDMSLCWDAESTLPVSGTAAMGTVGSGTGGHHGNKCDPLVKLKWKTQLWHNVSDYQIEAANEFNAAYVPIGEARVPQTLDTYIKQCKMWYTNIDCQLEQLLSQIRQTQTLCTVDHTLIDRDRDCWRVVQVANAGPANTTSETSNW